MHVINVSMNDSMNASMNTNIANNVREQLYSDMAPHHLTPLWRELHALVPKQPNTPCVPALWKYEQIRPYLMRWKAMKFWC